VTAIPRPARGRHRPRPGRGMPPRPDTLWLMTEQTRTELLYRYAIPSQVRRADGGSDLLLGTSGTNR
jgi:hypothetical protein